MKAMFSNDEVTSQRVDVSGTLPPGMAGALGGKFAVL
jgi:hypothetical protein